MIKTIIFDWGGVLTIGRYTKAILKNISERKNIDANGVYSEFDKLMVEMNSGKINFKEFVQKTERKLNLGINEEEMKEIFRKSIIFSEDVVQIAKELSQKYEMIMMSDNDEATVENLKKDYPDILTLFSKKYFSHELKMRKPDSEFFKHVLKDLNAKGVECIFIDDKQKNVDVAVNEGMIGILFTGADKLKEDLLSLGIELN